MPVAHFKVNCFVKQSQYNAGFANRQAVKTTLDLTANSLFESKGQKMWRTGKWSRQI